MNALSKAPFRNPRYAERRLEVHKQDDGGWILTNPMPFDGTVSHTLQRLLHWAEVAPDRTWLAERSGAGWRKVSFAESLDRILILAKSLDRFDLGQDRPLIILARNGIDHALISYAAMSQGIPIAPVSPQYGLPGADLTRLSHASQVIQPGAIYVDDASQFADSIAGIGGLAGLPVIASRPSRPSDIALEDLFLGSAAEVTCQGDQIAKLLLTSGSTGLPKAVMCGHSGMAANAAQIAACFDDDEPPVVVNSAPWSHSLGANAILHMVLHRGGTLYIDAGQPTPEKFAPTLDNLKDIAPTYHNMVPVGWGLFAGALESDPILARKFFSKVRVLQYGGASMPQSVCDRVQKVAVATVGERITFATGYGSTETGPTACNIHWPNDESGLCGLPVPGTSVRLAPQDGKFEMRVKGPQMFQGYYRRPELTADAYDELNFYRLGDAAKLADDSAPQAGLIFDGRLVENFKLTSGTFVAAGALRVSAVSALGGLASDALVCGEGQSGVGLLLFVSPDATDAWSPDDLRAEIGQRLVALNREALGSGARIIRAMILDGLPDPASGEITDKGYINQALARSRRPSELVKLFEDNPEPDVIVV
jgi:feruloyl-CoA synthase